FTRAEAGFIIDWFSRKPPEAARPVTGVFCCDRFKAACRRRMNQARIPDQPNFGRGRPLLAPERFFRPTPTMPEKSRVSLFRQVSIGPKNSPVAPRKGDIQAGHFPGLAAALTPL